MIAGKEPVVVVSSTVVADIVAAAICPSTCGSLGLMMFVQTNEIDPTFQMLIAAEAELKVTVNTPDIRVAVAK